MAASNPSTAPPLTEKERAVQREYWQEHSKKQGSSMENMMLDKSAAKLDLMDRPEILSLLPPYAGTRILELASGIGRFTGSLATTAASVVTVEFMEDFLAKNKELNDHLGNVEFLCADVLTLVLPPASFDLVFSCWIQMYLNDEEVKVLAARTLEWCKPGGHAFFRESCFRQSGDVSRAFNPSHYRHPSFYTSVFSQVRCVDPSDGVEYGLELVRARNLETYVAVKGNKGQMCWLWRKVPVVASSSSALPAAAAAAATTTVAPSGSPPLPATALSAPRNLQNGSSSNNGHDHAAASQPNALLATPPALATHDGVFGAGFGSDRLGGSGPAGALAAALGVGKGQRVVDWQTGLGGYGLWVAEKIGAKVWGVEERTALIEAAVQHSMAAPTAHTVLEACPLEGREFEAGSVDAVLVHTPPQPSAASFFARAATWLKPGGCVVAGLLVGSTAEGEAVQAALAQAVGEATVEDQTAHVVEWLSTDLAAFKAAGSPNPSEENGHGSINGNGHTTLTPAGLNPSEGTGAEAMQCWEGRLAQLKAGTLRWVVVKGVKKQ